MVSIIQGKGIIDSIANKLLSTKENKRSNKRTKNVITRTLDDLTSVGLEFIISHKFGFSRKPMYLVKWEGLVQIHT